MNFRRSCQWTYFVSKQCKSLHSLVDRYGTTCVECLKSEHGIEMCVRKTVTKLVSCFTSLPCFAQSSLVLEQGHQEHVCSTEGHFHCSVGHICCSDGHLYSSMGHFHSSVEHICSPEGHFHSSVGHICCSMGHLYSSEGHVYSSMGHFHSSMGHFLGSYGYCLLVSCSMWEADGHKRPHHHKDVWIPLRLVDDRSSRLRWRHTGTVCSLISRKPKLLHGTHRT